MQIYGIYFIIITIFLFYTKPAIGKKLLFKRNSISRNDEDWDEGAESFGRATSVKRQQPYDDNRRINKAVEFEDTRGDEPMELYSDKRNKKRSPFGVVYSGGQPIGVIEPLYQSYQFKNFDDTNHNYKKRDLNELFENDVMVETNPYENTANLHGGKYAAVLASFKIDNRLKSDAYKNDDAVSIEKRREKNRITKRDPLQNELPAKDLSRPSNFIGTPVAKAKRDTIDLEKIERNIINVMDDLGLADEASKNIQKRNVDATLQTDRERRDYGEDEDLENGPNKISMTKENLERSKKDYICPKQNSLPIEDGLKSAAVKNKRSHTPKILNYQYEGEEYIRKRRHNSNSGTIVKDLENSGELTISGNKSPLVSVNSEQNYSDNKRGINELTAVNNNDMQKRNNDYNDYERMLEKNIQNKIVAIKSDVKRELFNLKEKERIKRKANLTDNEGIIGNIKVNVKREMNQLNELMESKQINNIKTAEDAAKENLGNKKREINPLEVGGVRERTDASIMDFTDRDSKDESKVAFRRMSREVDDDLTYNDKYSEDKEDSVEIPFKRENKNCDDEEAIDVSVERGSANNVQKQTYNADVMKRSDEIHLANNSTMQTAQTANLGNAGNVLPAPSPPARMAPFLQPSNQLQQSQQQLQQPPPQQQQQQQQPLNMIQQASDQPPVNNLVSNGLQQMNAAPQVTQTYNAPLVANQSQFNGMINQDNAELVQKQQLHPSQDVNAASVYKPANIGANKPLGRQNLKNDYDQDDFDDKVQEVRSTDLELEDDGSVRFEKDIGNNDNTDEEDSDNEKNLVRQERFLQNISDEELRNLENENPSLEQRKRRQTVDFQNDDYNDEDYNIDSGGALIFPKRSKRAHYNTYGDNAEDMYSDIDNDDFDEPANQRIYRKRNLDSNDDYEMDNRNNYYNNDKRQRRNNNDPNYFQNSDVDSLDAVPDYYVAEDYRRRKRQALKRNNRKKRLGSKVNHKLAKDINIEALSNSELFGGLPQTFQGELSRFKRVKRSNDY